MGSSLVAEITNSCTSCHDELAPICEHSSKMMQEIFKVADKAGVKGNDCVVCHGGSPDQEKKEKAHVARVVKEGQVAILGGSFWQQVVNIKSNTLPPQKKI